MKLKTKNFNWLAGRPVVILNNKTAKKLNVTVDERVSIKFSKKRIYAIVDIFPKLVEDNQIGISNEIQSALKLKNNSIVEIGASELSESSKLIKKKLLGEVLSKKELSLLISEIVHNNITEAEIAYFVAAEKVNGMTMNEIISLTESMIENGKRIKFSKDKKIIDKHCVGGIAGNRTTPIVVAICASAGFIFPKTSSRAITSASGTADTIEAISNVEFTTKEIKKIAIKAGGCFAWGGSLGLAPSDDKIIEVEKILKLDVEPQLLASIMSKKVSVGAKYLLIDIPYGKNAKIKSRKNAKSLGKKFRELSKHFKIKIKIAYTDGSLPIGNGVGPTLEIRDIVAVLQNNPRAPQDLKEKSLYLSAMLFQLLGVKNAKKKAKEILESGKAYEKFKEIINMQNKKEDFEKRIKEMEYAKFLKIIRAKKTSRIREINNFKINSLGRILGSPETKTAGLFIHKKKGKIKKGEPIVTIYSESKSKLADGITFIKKFNPIILK